MTCKNSHILLRILLLSAPCVLYGADSSSDRRVLLAAHHDDADQAISEIFDELYTKPSETTYTFRVAASTVIGGATGAGTAVVLSKLVEHTQTRFVDPFTASAVSSVGLELFKTLPAAVGAIAALFAGYQVLGIFKAGILSPLERKFDKLQHENTEFKASVLKHQKEYETLTDELITKKLKKAEDDIKALLDDWFKQIDETNSQVTSSLNDQQKRLRALRGELEGKVTPEILAEIESIIAASTHNTQQLAGMHAISPETLEKYKEKHKKGALARFFDGIDKVFHRKKKGLTTQNE